MGISGNLLTFLENYLTNRKQGVVLNGVMSDILPMFAVVLQGRILGPILFLVYINDLPDDFKCNINLFADDSIIWDVVHDPISSTANINMI